MSDLFRNLNCCFSHAKDYIHNCESKELDCEGVRCLSGRLGRPLSVESVDG